MKKITGCILLLHTIITVNSQQYIEFPDSNARWNVYIMWFEIGYAKAYFINGDTTINNYLYSRIFVTNNDSILDTTNGSYVGLIREDSTKKIYFLPNKDAIFECNVADSNEILLYDFGINVNDTLTYYIDTLDTLHHIVVGIDSISIDGIFRKRFNINTIETSWLVRNSSWIEGIGSTLGLFNPLIYGNCPPQAYETNLICYLDENIVYNTGYKNNCFYSALIGNVSKDRVAEIKIYPNPSYDKIYIERKDNANDMVQLTIYNIFNSPLLESELKTKNQIVLDISNLPKGVYILQLKTNDDILTKKIIKL